MKWKGLKWRGLFVVLAVPFAVFAAAGAPAIFKVLGP